MASCSPGKLRMCCGFYLKDYRALDADGSRGGLLTAWNPVLFDCIRSWGGCYSLNVLLRRKADGTPCLISNIYGSTDPARKAVFFGELQGIKDLAPAVWALLGDFNSLLALQDKNGIPSNVQEILHFRSVVNEMGVFDLPLRNRSYTWSNGRRIPTLERLDRALVSLGWFSVFPDSSWRALPRPRSDHCPLVLTAFSFIPAASLFRFESHWLKHPAITETVASAWSSLLNADSTSLDPLARFTAKLNLVRSALVNWSSGLSLTIKRQRTVPFLDRMARPSRRGKEPERRRARTQTKAENPLRGAGGPG